MKGGVLLASLTDTPKTAALPEAPSQSEESIAARLAAAALEQTSHTVVSDGSYSGIAYRGGDVPPHIGVCTDVVIRSYCAVGIDVQERVHRDMKILFRFTTTGHYRYLSASAD